MNQLVNRNNSVGSLGEPLKTIVKPLLGDHCVQQQSVVERTYADLGSQGQCNRQKQRHHSRTSIRKHFHRLPTNIVPKHYELEFKPNFELFTFQGKTSVDIFVNIDTSTIVMNALDIDIQTAEVRLMCNVLMSKSISYSEQHETVTIELEDELPAGAAGTLVITYVGIINLEMKGLFRSKNLTALGEEKFAVLTHFEATHARRCFPCWDEPCIKATFEINLIVPMRCVALSNMPVEGVEPVGRGNHIVYFQRTPKMSTYLVAIVVGEYDHVECRTDIGVMLRVFVPIGRRDEAIFTLEMAAKMLCYHKNYFDVMFPLPKLDIVAIEEFTAGAMANWGLIVCRDTFVLFDPQHTAQLCKKAIALTLGHVIAQQWIGSLVTLEWWTYLWLNEGLPSYIKYDCVDKLFPEHDVWTEFITGIYTRALALDALRSTHPIQMSVKNPCEINGIFDDLSYNKSACVMRMLQAYIGERYFCKGLNLYLNRHQHRSTCTEDLWAALQQVSLEQVAEIMFSWIRFTGFPLVKVDSVQMGTTRMLKLTQTRFTSNGAEPAEDYAWSIPIAFVTSRSLQRINKPFLFHKKQMEFIIENIGVNDWIKLNPGSIGYYRTDYTADMLTCLMPAVRNLELSPIDRLGLIDDMFAIMQTGQTSTVDVLKLIESYNNETDYTVWTAITNVLTNIQTLIMHTSLADNFDLYGEKLYTPIAEFLGMEEQLNEYHLETRLRGLVLLRLVDFHSKHFLVEAQQLYQSMGDSAQPLNADMRLACYKAVLQNANDETFHHMLATYRSSEAEEERGIIARALGCISNVILLRFLLRNVALKEFHDQDAVHVLISVAQNPKGRDLAWQFFKDNSQTVLELCPSVAVLTKLIKKLVENFANEQRALEVEEFFNKPQFSALRKVISEALEKIHYNIAWLKRDLESLTEFLRLYQPDELKRS